MTINVHTQKVGIWNLLKNNTIYNTSGDSLRNFTIARTENNIICFQEINR